MRRSTTAMVVALTLTGEQWLPIVKAPASQPASVQAVSMVAPSEFAVNALKAKFARVHRWSEEMNSGQRAACNTGSAYTTC